MTKDEDRHFEAGRIKGNFEGFERGRRQAIA